MELNLGPRGQATIVLALVATLGALLGIVADRAFAVRVEARAASAVRSEVAATAGAPAAPLAGPWRWEARTDARYAERLGNWLALSATQRAEIDRIVAEEQVRVRELTQEVEPRFRAIAGETRTRIEAVLTDEQRNRLRTLREQRMRVRPDRPGPAAQWGAQRDSAGARPLRGRP
jgi:hypothetical protein